MTNRVMFILDRRFGFPSSKNSAASRASYFDDKVWRVIVCSVQSLHQQLNFKSLRVWQLDVDDSAYLYFGFNLSWLEIRRTCRHLFEFLWFKNSLNFPSSSSRGWNLDLMNSFKQCLSSFFGLSFIFSLKAAPYTCRLLSHSITPIEVF